MSTRRTRGASIGLALLCLVASFPLYADPQTDLFSLFQQVNTVAGNNDFTQGERTSLATKLIGALEALEKDHQNTAVNHLEAFQHEVDAMERSGRIPSADADALNNSAQAIIDQL